MINKKWMILDTCYTDTVIKKLDYVEEVKNCAKHEEITVLKNGGSLIFDWKGRLKYLPLNVHVDDNSIASILSLNYVNKIPGVCVTMDTLIEKAMSMIMRDGTVLKFKSCVSGLYYFDMERTDVQNSNKTN